MTPIPTREPADVAHAAATLILMKRAAECRRIDWLVDSSTAPGPPRHHGGSDAPTLHLAAGPGPEGARAGSRQQVLARRVRSVSVRPAQSER